MRNLAEDQKSAGAEIILKRRGLECGVEKIQEIFLSLNRSLDLAYGHVALVPTQLREFGGVLLLIGQMRRYGEFGGNGFC